jgi:hypothetical protein
MRVRIAIAVLRERGHECVLLTIRQPARDLGTIRQISERDQAEHHGGNAFDQKEPLPAVEPLHAAQREEQSRQRRAEDARAHARNREPRNRPRAFRARKPVCEIQDDAGKESGLGCAEHEAQHEKADRPADEDHRD